MQTEIINFYLLFCDFKSCLEITLSLISHIPKDK